MLRSHLIPAFRTVVRSKGFAAINIIGLAVGFCATILAALYVRDELTYDRFIPGRDSIYTVVAHLNLPNRAEIVSEITPAYFSQWLDIDFPQIAGVARLQWEQRSVRRGDIEINEKVNWADPTFFDLLPLPVLAGDLKGALHRPDGLVITRAAARKYFAKDTPLGEILEIDRRHPMRVAAVIEDLPSNTHLDGQIFASGRATFSPLWQQDEQPYADDFLVTVQTYVRVTAVEHVAQIESGFPDFLNRHMHTIMNSGQGKARLTLVALSDLHLYPSNFASNKPHGSSAVLHGIAIVGVLVLLIAATNFINLMTARATRRAREVGVRKSYGAMRHNLVAQFIGESMIYGTLAMILALGMVAVALPTFNAFLQRELTFDWWRQWDVLASVLACVVGIGALAGLYPAFVLSSFKPAAVLKGEVARIGNSGGIRQILVVLQFSILIVLVIGTLVIYKQTQFSLKEGLKFDREHVLLLYSRCNEALVNELRAVNGVRAVACSSTNALNMAEFNRMVTVAKGETFPFSMAPIDFQFFQLYGIAPVAGRVFAESRVADIFSLDANDTRSANVVLNATGARKFGFANVKDAIGASGFVDYPQKKVPFEVIGVIPDFAVDLRHRPVSPTMYVAAPEQAGVINLKLSSEDLQGTVAMIDSLWTRMGDPRPVDRAFLDEYIQALYQDVIRQGILIGILAGIAVIVACLGLFALSIYMAERRTKEIGVRKAFGALPNAIVGMLLWDFSRPVLYANLLAWPIAYALINSWLQGFAYRIDLNVWMFVAASAAALAIALLTTSVHALRIANTKPVIALRYE